MALITTWIKQVLTNGVDHAVGAIDVGAITFIMGNNGGATDQQRHFEFLAGMTDLCRF